MQELSIRFRYTKKQKCLNVGTLLKKALDKIYGQTLQIWGFLNIGSIQFFKRNLRLCTLGKHIYNMREAWALEVILAINLNMAVEKF